MHEEKKYHGRFMEGFFWGAVVGSAVAYVLSHKKGREIVKELIQDGIDFIEDKAEKAVKNEDFLEQETEIEEPPMEAEIKDEKRIETESKQSVKLEPQAPRKRFFKKIKK